VSPPPAARLRALGPSLKPLLRWLSRFEEFFQGKRKGTAAPQAAGYDAFFRGSFAYHWHNNWYANAPLHIDHSPLLD
jgi:hypothetical protein